MQYHTQASMNGSVDAKLAAAAAVVASANAAAVGGVDGSITKQQLQAQQQQQHGEVGGTGGTFSGHHHHHHHHHTASTSQLPSQRSKKIDNLLLSLPSQDREAWYDRSTNHALEVDPANVYDDGDGDYTSASKTPRLTNRGHKLAAEAKFVRQGRLGGWENHEIFESRSTFPSNNHYPAGLTSSAPGHANSSIGRNLPGGFSITPSLSLVPSSSLAAGRPDKDLSSLPSPHKWLSAGSPTSASPTYIKKKRKSRHGYSYGALASTSSSAAAYTSAPVRAYLPVSPQNPIELVMSPLITRTFSPRNRTLERLSLSATELIEQDIPLVKALTRLIDFMRGNSIAGLGGVIGLPFSGEEESLSQTATLSNGIRDDAKVTSKEEKQNVETDTVHVAKTSNTSVALVLQPSVDTEKQPEREQIQGIQDSIGTKIDLDNSVSEMQVDETPANPENIESLVNPRKRRRSLSITSKDEEETLATCDTTADPVTRQGHAEHTDIAEKAETAENTVTEQGEAEVSDADVLMLGSASQQGVSARDPQPSTLPKPVESEIDDEEREMPSEHEHEEVEHNNSASRSPSSSASLGNDETDQSQKTLLTTKLMPSVLRIANPLPYIESLFVSDEELVVPLIAGQDAATTSTAMPTISDGNNPLSATATGGEVNGTTSDGYIRLSPIEQLETVRLCLGELTRFLADSLEYQDRMSEIRDQVLGVERRRKGVWNMARGYAHQLLWEDEQEKARSAAGV